LLGVVVVVLIGLVVIYHFTLPPDRSWDLFFFLLFPSLSSLYPFSSPSHLDTREVPIFTHLEAGYGEVARGKNHVGMYPVSSLTLLLSLLYTEGTKKKSVN
jgi:hypothetical protein